jgi:hypothetical protein
MTTSNGEWLPVFGDFGSGNRARQLQCEQSTLVSLLNDKSIIFMEGLIKPLYKDKESSRGTHNIVYRSFDRITFNWIGKYGARIFVRFNCLSTDFSRIKGVKGIPLRIHVESRVVDEPGNRVEKSICRARIFRDKVIVKLTLANCF